MDIQWTQFEIKQSDTESWTVLKNETALPDGKSREDYPQVMYLTFQYPKNTPASEALPSLSAIEAAILENINTEQSLLAAVIQTDEAWDFIVYSNQGETFCKQFYYLSEQFSQFACECTGTQDELWQQYDVLEPSKVAQVGI